MEQVKIDGEPDLHTVDLTVRTVACQYQLEGRPVSEIGLRTIIQKLQHGYHDSIMENTKSVRNICRSLRAIQHHYEGDSISTESTSRDTAASNSTPRIKRKRTPVGSGIPLKRQKKPGLPETAILDRSIRTICTETMTKGGNVNDVKLRQCIETIQRDYEGDIMQNVEVIKDICRSLRACQSALKVTDSTATSSSPDNTPTKRDFKCGVCLDSFIENDKLQPRALKCGHIFCSSCVEMIFEKQSERVSCPNCRQRSNYNQSRNLFWS